MKDQLSSVQESLLILCTIQALLDKYKKLLAKESKHSNSVLFSLIGSQIILASCSYMDEWELLGKLSKEEPKILKLRKTVKPAIDRINQWKDMRHFRNSIIAHNHRIKKLNNSPAILTMERELNCPNSFYDYKLLMGCIFITKNVLLRLFDNEYSQLQIKVKNISGIKPFNEITDKRTFDKEFDEIIKEVEILMTCNE